MNPQNYGQISFKWSEFYSYLNFELSYDEYSFYEQKCWNQFLW
jgi:hypothetical protein